MHGVLVRALNLLSMLKVINTVTKLLQKLEDAGVLEPAAAPDPVAPSAPRDERSMVVKEILDSERKYVQDLEVLQVRPTTSRCRRRLCEGLGS